MGTATSGNKPYLGFEKKKKKAYDSLTLCMKLNTAYDFFSQGEGHVNI